MEQDLIIQNVVEKMLNNKNENVIGGYVKKTYTELVEELSPEEIDELYYYLEQLTEKNVSKDKVRRTDR